MYGSIIPGGDVAPGAPPLEFPNGLVLMDDTFGKGLRGWSGLIDTGENYYPMLYPTGLHDERSMVIDTRGGVVNTSAIAAKRGPAIQGRWNFKCWFAWNADQASYLRYLRFPLDWQVGNEITGTRKWPEVRYTHWNEANNSIIARWDLGNGQAGNYGDPVGVLDGYELGHNQTYKWDWHFIEWQCKLHVTQGFTYEKLAVDGIVADLTGQTMDANFGEVAEFDNGSNLLFYCVNRSNNSSADPYMLIDRIRVEVQPLG